jgi:predicted DsbA family dithiol-disulfide isomerase
MVDLSALASAALLLHPSARSWPRAGARWIAAAAPVAVLAVAIPLLMNPAGGGALPPVSALPSAGLPVLDARDVALDHQPDEAQGGVQIVDYVDFQCPHCRAFHSRLVQAIDRAELERPVRVVRRMVPLPVHRGAMVAAIAWCCADAQGHGDAMAEALITAPIAELTAEGCERIAAALGLDLRRYRADAASAGVRARIQADLAAARAAGIRGLPTVWVGDHVFQGAEASVDELVAALRRADI